MRIKQYRGKPYGMELTSKERKAMDMEISRQIVERDKSYQADVDAMVLYVLLSRYGWKKKRLRKFWDAFNEEHKKLREYYLMEEPDDNIWLAHRMLANIGVDVHEWVKENED